MQVMAKIGNQKQTMHGEILFLISVLQSISSCVFRRFNLYTRSCTAFASLFAIGFVLIIIVVLSLIPLYISKSSTTKTTNIQTSSIIIIRLD